MDELLTVHEAAELLRVKVSQLQFWCRKRRVPFRRHGKSIVFNRAELCSWSAAQAVQPNDAA
jgi:excisionase family DNA binding protein